MTSIKWLGVEVGIGLIVAVGHDPGLGILACYVESMPYDHGSADLRSESLERFADMRLVAIYVEVICIHGCDHRNFREKLEEGPVELVGFSNDHVVGMCQEIAVVVLRYASEKSRASFSAVREQMAHKCACGRLAVCACYCHAPLSLCDLSQHARALDHPVALLLHVYKLSHVLRNGRGIYYQCAFHVSRYV